MLKLRMKTCFLLFCLVCAFFFSVCIILITLASEHHNFYHSFQRPLVTQHSDIRSELFLEWTAEEEERIVQKLIQQTSLHRTKRSLHGSSSSGEEQGLWRMAASLVSSSHTYPANSSAQLGHILHGMHSRPISRADVSRVGTQLKLSLTLAGAQKAVFKPKWYEREHVLMGTPYEGKDRHNGEIAAFHLSRILDMRRTPLVVGRVLDLQKEILPVATKALKNTFFRRDKQLCFLGKCRYCRSRDDAACAVGGMMEGVVVLWLPGNLTYKQFAHPWRRSYKTHVTMQWEKELEELNLGDDMLKNNTKEKITDDKKERNKEFTQDTTKNPENDNTKDLNDTRNRAGYCSEVVNNPLYRYTPLFYDLIDTCVFDFLIGNADRHHFQVFHNSSVPLNTTWSHSNAFLIMLDNGKSFGNPYRDELSVLAPLLQCNTIRKSTAKRLNALKGGLIMRVLKAVLTVDSLPKPIITNAHMLAISRRLEKVVEILRSGRIYFH